LAILRKSRANNAEQLTCLLEELPARISALQDSERAWLESAATSHWNFLDWLTACGPAGWYGRTFPESIPQLPTQLPIVIHCELAETESASGKTYMQMKRTLSPVFWPDFKNSGMGSPTELWTLNTLEYHSAAAACSLSDILETGDVPQRFYLSDTACRGILRRAERRGKTLPAALRRALMEVAG
jgi:hypothetical protein